ncbi:hypothetical protein RRH01S_12_00470 [Rhizobium rhizogenes NBRC 13257]|uniref:Uncharacterized protein n=1 Tax=Rhizobium rhizogenes NBRC 13257 TaxID=1220581 RepID=A0AA87Q4P8_RHIRH|nr:LuxR family transcriptional regulator [Rhizobium rhizogenes]GAJ95490.1 hypothetical protein RRH01S_12_00470 [Rhizobium rhizogenes NBRC 13257]
MVINNAGRGKTLGETALLEGKSVAEIEDHLRRAVLSLGTKSIKEALYKANLPEPY